MPRSVRERRRGRGRAAARPSTTSRSRNGAATSITSRRSVSPVTAIDRAEPRGEPRFDVRSDPGRVRAHAAKDRSPRCSACTSPTRDQHFAQRTLQSHTAPHGPRTSSTRERSRSSSRSEYSGLIKVAKGAQGTDAYQANRNLVLSEDALARSIPQLEIEANEVRCTHGATVSPVEEEHLFYLMSRGIDRVTAQKLVVFGFFGDVLDRIRVPAVRDELSSAISAKVEGRQRLEVADLMTISRPSRSSTRSPTAACKQVCRRRARRPLPRRRRRLRDRRRLHPRRGVSDRGEFDPDELEVECPLHGSRFNVVDGRRPDPAGDQARADLSK